MAKSRSADPIPEALPAEPIDREILTVRGQRVILDADLAALYGETTKRLNQQVSRNLDRFPPDFMIELTSDEWAALRLQFATSNAGRGGRRFRPRAFTQEGIAMLSSVLRSQRAVRINIEIMRAFVRLRQVLAADDDLAERVRRSERRLDQHEGWIGETFAEIDRLKSRSRTSRKRVVRPTTEHGPGERRYRLNSGGRAGLMTRSLGAYSGRFWKESCFMFPTPRGARGAPPAWKRTATETFT